MLMRLVDEPHHSVTVLACPRCGQRFVKVFTETIDWQDGEDPQHWELMPISEGEARLLMIVVDLKTLPRRRSLVVDHPKGEELTLRWAAGVEVREHD